MIRLRRAGLVAALLHLVACPAAADDLSDAVYRAHYQFEHLGYCGMADEAARAALDRKVSAAMNAGLSRDAMEQARMKAWADAYREWLNRGLGGFRAWCENEGPVSRDALLAD